MSGQWGVIEFTLKVCLGSSLAILPPGTALAWWLAKTQSPWKVLIETAVSLPLVIPPVATGLVLLDLFGRRGPIGALLRSTLRHRHCIHVARGIACNSCDEFSAPGPLGQTRVRISQSAARTDCGNPRGLILASLFTVTIPLASRGILAGFLLSFARAIGEFGATILVAGNIPGKTTTLSLSIYSLVQLGKDREAFSLVAVSVVIAFIAVFLSEQLLRKKREIR